MSLSNIQQQLSSELSTVSQLISINLMELKNLDQLSAVKRSLINITNSHGKQIRPMVVLLASKLFNYSGDQHLSVAAAVEILHTATLLHDDIIDNSALRRNQVTLHQQQGNKHAVMLGNWLFNRALKLLLPSQNIQLIKIISQAASTLVNGELTQLVTSRQIELNYQDYLQIIYSKTAALFEASAKLGAILANQSPQVINHMATYGKNLGMAFQISDDALDYHSEEKYTGKNIGDDFLDQKITLPLLYGLQQANSSQRKKLINNFYNNNHQKKIDNLAAIIQLVNDLGGIEYAVNCAKQHINLAIDNLEKLAVFQQVDQKVLQKLIDLANLVPARIG